MKTKLLNCLLFALVLCSSYSFSAVIIRTNPTKYIGIDTAISGGNILNTGGEQITEAGVCWSTNPQPTVNDSKSIRSASTDSFTCILRNLIPEKGYYIRAYAITASGIYYGPQRTFATDKLEFGKFIKGGLLFYVNKPGDPGYVAGEIHGMVLCPLVFNPTASFIWAPKDSFIGVTDTSMFTGLSNTTEIVNAFGEGQYAAWICYNLNYNGYSDWYLPSITELITMRKSLVPMPAQPWSSTEVDNKNAYLILGAKTKKISLKSNKARIIPIRNF